VLELHQLPRHNRRYSAKDPSSFVKYLIMTDTPLIKKVYKIIQNFLDRSPHKRWLTRASYKGVTIFTVRQPSMFLIAVIPDILNRESILISFGMDPRLRLAGMTTKVCHARRVQSGIHLVFMPDGFRITPCRNDGTALVYRPHVSHRTSHDSRFTFHFSLFLFSIQATTPWAIPIADDDPPEPGTHKPIPTGQVE
jgi:hypothetical protein